MRYVTTLRDIESNLLDVKNNLKVYELTENHFVLTMNWEYIYFLEIIFKFAGKIYYKYRHEDIRRI